MKKVFAIALALVMLLGAVACAAPAANTATPAATTGATAFVTADG